MSTQATFHRDLFGPDTLCAASSAGLAPTRKAPITPFQPRSCKGQFGREHMWLASYTGQKLTGWGCGRCSLKVSA